MQDRKKPSQLRSTDTVKSIVTAASDVVTKSGVAGATIEKIAARAGVSPGSIYQYFSGKKSILGSFVEQELDGNRKIVMSLLEEWKTLSIRELNKNLTGFVADYFHGRASTAGQVFAHSHELGQGEIHMKMRREVISALAEVLKQHRSELVVDDCDRAAAVVVHSVMGAFTAPLLDKELPYSIQDLRSDVVAMVNRYLLGS